MEIQVDITKGTPVPFMVRSEPWNRYKLEDGTIIHGKLVLTKVIRINEFDATGQPIYIPSAQNLFASYSPAELKGTPTIASPTAVDKSTLNTTAIEFENIGVEEWNVYEFSDGTVFRVKLEVTSVFRTDRFTPDGDPFYVFNTTVVPRWKIPSQLVKKQQPKLPSQPKSVYG